MDIIEAIVNASIEFGGVFFGLIIGFIYERGRTISDFNKRVRQIVPYIYYESLENKYLIEQYRQHTHTFEINRCRFKTTNFNLFKTELGHWRELNVVPITRLYDKLTIANIILDEIESKTKPQNDNRNVGKLNIILNSSENLIIKLITQYDNWFKKHTEANNENEKVFKELKINEENDPDIRDFLKWYTETYLKRT